jgi:nucleoredoxin
MGRKLWVCISAQIGEFFIFHFSITLIDGKYCSYYFGLIYVIFSSVFFSPFYFNKTKRCGPCRQFTPDLVNFYNKMNSRMGKKDEFEIVWISRCRTIDAFGQYFTQMNWLALPPNEAMGDRGKYLGEKFNVKSIPTLVLLDEIGNVITTDARNKIPLDKAGIGFPWRSPVSVLISTLVPRTFRLMVKGRLNSVMGMIKRVLLGKGTKITDALVRVIKR